MRDRIVRRLSVVKTIALGGLFFLLPLVVVAYLLSQLAVVVNKVAHAIGDVLPLRTPLGYAILFLLALALILMLCFMAGMVARRSIGQRFHGVVETYLLMLFPRYAIFKEQLNGNLGGALNATKLRPVLAQMQDVSRIGMLVEESSDGLVTVYLPSSPDPWSGTVVVLRTEQVRPLTADFGQAMGTFEKLGRGTQAVVKTGFAPNP